MLMMRRAKARHKIRQNEYNQFHGSGMTMTILFGCKPSRRREDVDDNKSKEKTQDWHNEYNQFHGSGMTMTVWFGCIPSTRSQKCYW